jgi:methionyl-tRNA formyltransferase
MKKYILVSEKKWHLPLFELIKEQFEGSCEWIYINSKEEFTKENLVLLKPEKIFIPHWSHIIPSEIYDQFECIVFHMTDLPYGRGGSPLQNLIVRGHESTVISALKVNKGLDTGGIYLKNQLNLNGSAEEIFLRASQVIFKMIIEIIENELNPLEQKGEVISFKRRKPEDGNIIKLDDINEVYDYIRMLDAEGYPNAFIETDNLRFEFTRASLKSDQKIIADVRISKK